MSITENPEAQDGLSVTRSVEHLRPNLARATLRLEFPPSYVFVGVYRLITDKNLYGPVWDKCKHGTRRGAIVGGNWVRFSSTGQDKLMFCAYNRPFSLLSFKRDSSNDFYPSTSLSKCHTFVYSQRLYPFLVHHELLVYHATPCLAIKSRSTSIHVCLLATRAVINVLIFNTDAAVLIVGSQVTYILRFFLSRNLRIARDRAWDQTVASRGKGPDFWQPYVEEWQNPPSLDSNSKMNQFVSKWLGGWFGLFVVKHSTFSNLQDDVIGNNFDMDSSSFSSAGLPLDWFHHLCLV
jgi:hypothetical protein